MTAAPASLPRPSIRWAVTTRTAMRSWSDTTGQPGVTLVRDALGLIAADAAGAVAAAGAGLASPPAPAVNIPVDGQPDRELWDQAAAALDAAYGGAIGVGAVVRALVTARLAAER